MSKLTSTTIAKMQPGDILRDDQVPGLHARRSGKRTSFYLYFRTPTRQERRPKIGDYGVLTIPQAREIARGWLLKNAVGEAVKEALTTSQRATVRDLYDIWVKEHKPKLKPESQRGMECQWQLHILPRHGKKIVSEYTSDDAQELIDALSQKSPILANRVRSLASKAFKIAEKKKMRAQNTNPFFYVDRNKETARERYLTPDELQRLGRVLSHWLTFTTETQRWARYFLLLMMTGARKNELLRARREWLDLDAQILKLPDSKTGAKIITLPAPAVRMIREMIGECPGSEWLFPGRTPGDPLYNPYVAWESLLKAAEIKDLRIHDLRHSFASVGISMLGYDLKRIGKTLGHASVATTERYAHLMTGKQLEISEGVASAIERLMLPAPVVGAVTLTDANPLPIVDADLVTGAGGI